MVDCFACSHHRVIVQAQLASTSYSAEDEACPVSKRALLRLYVDFSHRLVKKGDADANQSLLLHWHCLHQTVVTCIVFAYNVYVSNVTQYAAINSS